MTDIPDTRHNILAGAALMVGYAICQTIVWSVARYLGAPVSPEVLFFFRNLVGAALVLPLIIRSKGQVLKTDRIGTHFIRSIAALVGGLSLFVALLNAPLATVVAITFLAPVLASAYNIFVDGKKASPDQILSLILAFSGMLIILRPSGSGASFGLIAALVAALATAAAYIYVRKLSTTESTRTQVAYPYLFLLPFSALIALPRWRTPDPSELVLILILGGAFAGAQYCLARAFLLAPASVVMPIDFSRLLFASLAGALLFQDTYDIPTTLGSVMIFGAGLIVALKPKPKADPIK